MDNLISNEQKQHYHKYLLSHEWAIRKRIALDFYKSCVLCDEKNALDVHHRSYKNLYKETLKDLVVLCRECHCIFHSNKEDMPITIRGVRNRHKDKLSLVEEYTKWAGEYHLELGRQYWRVHPSDENTMNSIREKMNILESGSVDARLEQYKHEGR